MMEPALLLVFLSTADATGAPETPSASEAWPKPEISEGSPIDLATALRTADRRNLSLNAARLELDKAQADLTKAWAILHPRASGNLTLTHNDHADVAELGPGQRVEIRPQDVLQGQLQVSMPLVSPRDWVGIGAADTAAEIASWSAEQVRQATLFAVAQAYFAALSARSLIDVQRSQLEATQRHLTIASLRHRSGTGNRLDVIRAQNDHIRAREDLISAHTVLDNARDALARLLGADGLPMPTEVAPIPEPPEPAVQLAARAVQEREDMKLFRGQVQLADRQLLATWMSFLPTIDAAWQLNQQVTDPSAFGSTDKSRWFLGLTLTVPLYDYVRHGELDRGRATLAQAALRVRDAGQQVELEVRQAHRRWLESAALVKAAQERSQLAREALRIAEAAYEAGTGSSLEVTDARRTHRQAEINMATRRYDAQLALLTLLRRAGGDILELAAS